VFEFFRKDAAHSAWAVGIVLGLPLALLLLTEAAVRLRRRGSPLESPVRVVRNLLVPALAAYVLLAHVAGLDPQSYPVRVVLTLAWIFGLHAAFSFLNVALFAAVHRESWRARVPNLARDLARLLLVLVGAALVLSTVWGTNLAGLVTALGVGSVVLGLALQDPLGNLYSGVILLFEQPFVVGDWLRVGDTVGQVVEVNWRAVHLLVGGTEVQVIPNSALAKGSFGNVSRPTRQHAETITLDFSHDDPPNKVKRVLRTAASRTPGVLEEPAPSAATVSYKKSAVRYALVFHVADYAEAGPVRDELLTRIWYAARRHRLRIRTRHADPDAAARAPLPAEDLRVFPQLGLARAGGLGEGLSRGAVRQYARGERVVAEGEVLSGLHLILGGHVALTVRDGAGQEKEVARLARGEFFGEKALLGVAISDVTVTALEDLEVLVLEGEALQALVEQTPRAAQEVGRVLEARRRAMRKARLDAGGRLPIG
jgi:small-conductance mechanosensitive channel